MENKIVILFEVPPVVTYAQRYDYKTLTDAEYNLDICDLSNLTSEYHSGYRLAESDSDHINTYRFKTRKEFIKYINNLDENVFIWSTFQLTAEYYWIFKAISRYRYGFICNVDYVAPRSVARITKKDFWTTWSMRRLKNALLVRTPQKFLPIRKADAVITYSAGNVQRILNNILYDEHTVVELTNTIDYNECMRSLDSESDIKLEDLPPQYVLFIDEYLPYHPDGLKLGLHIDGDNYYKEIRNFLNRISSIMNIPVIIAAHPKADYSLHSDCYQGMRVIQYHTPELIQKAHMIITHISIAVSMILVSRKPYMLITTNDVRNELHGAALEDDHTRDLRNKIVNISKDFSDEEIEAEIMRAKNLDNEYFDGQLMKYKLPSGHENERLSFGQIMIKAMEEVRHNENKTF